jgi:hypothetical protein
MKKQINLTGNDPSGYGHRELTIEVDFERYSAVTSNMPMTDAINSDDDEESNEAQIRAMKFVCDKNDIDYSDAEFLIR